MGEGLAGSSIQGLRRLQIKVSGGGGRVTLSWGSESSSKLVEDIDKNQTLWL